MKRAALYGAICCTLFHLRLAGSSHELEMCTDPPINYHVSSFTFSPSAEAHISCNINSPQWWVSEDPCGPFTRSALCPQRSNLCSFNVTHIANSFYHCCTSGGAVEDSLAEVGDSGNCVRIEICTTIIEDTVSHPPFAYFGERVLIYIQIYSHPLPNQTHEVLLLNSTVIEETKVSIFQPSPNEPRFFFEYSIFIPSATESDTEATLFFCTEFLHGVCSSNPAESASIRVINRGDTTNAISTTILPPSTAQSPGPSDGVRVEDQCTVNTGLMGAVIVLTVFLIAVVVVLSVAIIYLVYLVRKQKKQSSIALSSSNSDRPTSLDVREYLRLPSRDQTPSPAVQYVNCPSNQQNGNHMQHGRVGQAMSSTTPQTPSSLALGYSQRSHTGQTPLLAPTPNANQPFPNADITTPPSYDQVVGAGCSEQDRSQVSSGEYATLGVRPQHGTSPSEVGGATSSPVPIYSNATITELASNVQLEGADVASQTVV